MTTKERDEDAAQLLNVDLDHTKFQGQLRVLPFKLIAKTWAKEAATATRASVDQQDSHHLQPPHSPSLQ